MNDPAIRQTRRIALQDATTRDAEAVERALTDPEFRALAITVGALLPFSNRIRAAILELVKAKLSEDDARKDLEAL